MSDAAEELTGAEEEAHGLDDLIGDLEAEEQTEQRQREKEAEQAEKLTAEQEAKVRAMAERINSGFLFVVDRAVCPSVPVDQVADREKGNEAFYPLAKELGGEMPEWLAEFLDKYNPYIKAGVYMGMTIYTARICETAAVEAAENAEAEGGDSGGQ